MLAEPSLRICDALPRAFGRDRRAIARSPRIARFPPLAPRQAERQGLYVGTSERGSCLFTGLLGASAEGEGFEASVPLFTGKRFSRSQHDGLRDRRTGVVTANFPRAWGGYIRRPSTTGFCGCSSRRVLCMSSRSMRQGWAVVTLAPRIGVTPTWMDFWHTSRLRRGPTSSWPETMCSTLRMNGFLIVFGVAAAAVGWRSPGSQWR
jgi:hypothetical protein